MRDGPMLTPAGWWEGKKTKEQRQIQAKNMATDIVGKWIEKQPSSGMLTADAYLELRNLVATAIEQAMAGNEHESSSPEIIHGETCPKAIHDGTGFLHEANDDSPYVIDNVRLCGRCHRVL